MKENKITTYTSAVAVIKAAILKSQARAAQAVNQELLALYYGIGRYISHNSRKGTWGTNAIKTISEQLKHELPGLRGFSETSLKKMRQFYEQWQIFEFRPPLADEMETSGNEVVLDTNVITSLNRPPMAGNLDVNDFLSISFTHHDEILSKTSTLEDRVF